MDILSVFGNLASLIISRNLPPFLDTTLRPIDSSGCLECRTITYDFIIVGGGTAGCVLANRLSENSNWNVLLIEAGGDEDELSEVPAMIAFTVFTNKTWDYNLVWQKYACQIGGGKCPQPVGKVLGGSSAINGMLLARGNPKDFDEWEMMGNPGWSYKDVLPYFLKFENMSIPSLINTSYHSQDGPIGVSYGRYFTQLQKDLLQAGIDYGLNNIDYNGEEQYGVSYSQNSMIDGKRCSTSKAYLNPIRDRKNLYIFKHTLVTKILLSHKSKTAIGVTCITNGEEYNVYASKEIILSAGAFNTPKLLMLSGIGPKEHLKELNIPVYIDLPVGQNLVQHPGVFMWFYLNGVFLKYPKTFSQESVKEYFRSQSGPLTSPTHSVDIFMNHKNLTLPNVQLIFGAIPLTLVGVETKLGYVYVTHLKPKSIGYLKLRSSNYLDSPIIDPKIAQHPNDREVLFWAMRQSIQIMKLPSMKKYSSHWISELAPHCYLFSYLSDDFLNCLMQFSGTPTFHPVGTARMGPDKKLNVVDSTLKVHGINNLRVVDASIMPTITRGNTMAPVIMIAEKASDIIINSYKNK